MSSGVRALSEFADYSPYSLLDYFPVESPTDKDSCTKLVYECIRKGMPLYTLRRRYYKPVRWMLLCFATIWRPGGAPKHDKVAYIDRRVVDDRRPAMR